MSKGLEALIRIEDLLNRLYETDVIDDDFTHDANIIEQELKEAEENKAMLDIFKNALTIEHDLSTPSFTPLKKDNPFDVNAIIIETIKIRQNDIDEKLRKSLREWVLKNAFPKELKEYHELESMHEELAKSYNKLCQEKLEWLKQKQALEIIKRKKVNVEIFLNHSSGRNYNEFLNYEKLFQIYKSSVEQLTQEEYELLKKVLL